MKKINNGSAILFSFSLIFIFVNPGKLVSESTTKPSANPIIGHLQGSKRIITIEVGQNGPVYTVRSEKGEILATKLSASKLYSKFPKLKDWFERGFAEFDASLGPDGHGNWKIVDPEKFIKNKQRELKSPK